MLRFKALKDTTDVVRDMKQEILTGIPKPKHDLLTGGENLPEISQSLPRSQLTQVVYKNVQLRR